MKIYILKGEKWKAKTLLINFHIHFNFVSSLIDHICLNLLVPSAQKINIEDPGNQVNYWGGGGGGGGG